MRILLIMIIQIYFNFNIYNMEQQINSIFMAFATGVDNTVESNNYKLYTGVAPVRIISVNPTKDELEKIYGTTIDKDIDYVFTKEDGSISARIDFYYELDKEFTGTDTEIKRESFFIRKEPFFNKDKTKVKVINKYGECTWLSIEDAKNRVIPETLSWFDPADFRAAYIGEEEITLFLKSFLGIPNKSYKNKKGEIVELPNKSEAEARFSNFDKFFTGDFTEIKTAIKSQPLNKIKRWFGVKITDDNKMYQTFYSEPIKNRTTDYSYVEAKINQDQSSGRFSNVYFKDSTFKEYVNTPKPTDFKNDNNLQDNPFLPF